jgi:hypothetical protein
MPAPEATLDENGVHTAEMWQLFLNLVAAARVMAEAQPGSARKIIWEFKQLEAKTADRIARLENAKSKAI